MVVVSRTQADVDETIKALTELGSAAGAAAVVAGCCADVGTKDGRETLVAFVATLWDGRIDALVNNVGVNIRKRVEDATEEEYRTMMRTNGASKRRGRRLPP